MEPIAAPAPTARMPNKAVPIAGIMIMTNIRNSGNKTTNINTNNAGNQKSLPSSTFLRSDFNAAHNLQPI